MDRMARGSTVLIVDDEARNRRLLTAFVLGDDLCLLEAEDGAQALKLLSSEHVDLVLLDLMLPDMDGLEILRHLKDSPASSSIPVIVITAVQEREIRLRALAMGADDFLCRPVDRLELRARMCNLLRLKRLTDEHELRNAQLNELVEERAEDWLALVHSAPGYVMRLDLMGKVAFLNRAATPAQHELLLGRHFTEFSQDREGALQGQLAFDTTVQKGVVTTYETLALGPDGATRTYECRLGPVRHRGQIVGAVAFAFDITERKRLVEEQRESERKLSTLLSNLPGMVYRCRNDDDYSMEFISEGCQGLTGYASEQLLPPSSLSFCKALIHPDDREAVVEQVTAAVEKQLPFRLSYRLLTRGGGEKWVAEHGQGILGEDGTLEALEGFIFDVTEQRRSEQALKEQSARLTAVGRAIPDPLFLMDEDGRYLEALGSGDELMANDSAALRGKLIADLLEPELADMALATIRRTLQSNQPQSVEYALDVKVGRRWFEGRCAAAQLKQGGKRTVVWVARDITRRRQMEAELTHNAFHDSLTGLPNRSLFMDCLCRGMEAFSRHASHRFAVLFIDLDRFKNVNDGLGHEAGDLLLVGFADRLRRITRNVDTFARLGGDEFAAVLPDTDATEALKVAERILKALETPFHIRGQTVFISGSIGIALSGRGYQSAEEYLRDADTAMYRAKADGRGRCALFDETMHTKAVALLRLESELRQAMSEHQFEVHYQPIFDLRRLRPVGMEALIRWKHPTLGFVSPMEFIPVAEETGLIVPLGRFVLKEACSWLRDFRLRAGGRGPEWVAVNLSVCQFSQADLVGEISQLLASTGLPGSSLKLEITETALIKDADSAALLLKGLRELGIRIAIDDFGTGYSSLGYLNRFPLDVLKLDRSFISGIEHEKQRREIVRSIVSLAHILDLEVVAEGVEDAAQLTHLRGMECDFVQGYYFSRPLAGPDIQRFWAEDIHNNPSFGIQVAQAR